MTTIYSAFRAALATLFLVFLVACGGGGDEGPFRSVGEVAQAFEAAPDPLQDYFRGGDRINPDTIMTATIMDDGYRLVVEYKGKVIYDQRALRWVIYAYHGYAGGRYVIRIYVPSPLSAVSPGVSIIFVDGQELPVSFLKPGELSGVRDYQNEWIILQWTELQGYYDPTPGASRVVKYYVVYDSRSGKLIDYGAAP